ncbi:cell division protein FtsQ/DivIB [Enhygromyxa salina]|uniref:Cell division protein FtsQ n=1 Tax=Enhygromyxa salina TaxID=215803 RepID=A0A2S9YYC2_9BACT|nr:FtsQ-type POTRA domain-containing protein [Enhygromyxa salina]PRQ10091.1 cell division protein FtsQ [Enhygromyxa salina]
MTTPIRSRQRTKQPAAARRPVPRARAGAQGRTQQRGRNSKRKPARNGASEAIAPEKRVASGRLSSRLRAVRPALAKLFARREGTRATTSSPRAEPKHREPREWPRRLGKVALKLGATVAVAWGLLIAGREVYEYATTSTRFEVQHIIYDRSPHVDDDQLRELLAIEPGTNILACDLAELSERVAAHPWVAMATVTRNLPDTLGIEVVEHEPAAIVLAGRFYLVNGEGQPFKVVERGERSELPIITGVERSALAEADGQAIPQLVTALDVIRVYQSKQRPRLGELHLDDDGSLTLYTAEAGTQLRLGRTDFETRLGRWDALRAALGDRADHLAVVHLDNESKPDRRDRVVARFATEHDEAVLLAQAASALESDDEAREPTAKPAADLTPAERRAQRRNRIPSYE